MIEQLETQRLILRPFRATDGDALYSYLSREEVVRYEPFDVMDRETCLYAARARERDKRYIAVILKGGALIGHLYFNQTQGDTYELGYIFSPDFQHLGYATEAATALLRHAFTRLNVRRVVACCDPENTASWRLMERLGMRREAHFIKDKAFRHDENGRPIFTDSYSYAILSSEFKA